MFTTRTSTPEASGQCDKGTINWVSNKNCKTQLKIQVSVCPNHSGVEDIHVWHEYEIIPKNEVYFHINKSSNLQISPFSN